MRPTRSELETAWARIGAGGVILDFHPQVLADIVRGAPEYDPTRYSDAEVRLAEGVLVLAGALLELRLAGDLIEMAEPNARYCAALAAAAAIVDPDGRHWRRERWRLGCTMCGGAMVCHVCVGTTAELCSCEQGPPDLCESCAAAVPSLPGGTDGAL